MQKRIWITWENHRRNRSMSKVLKAKLFEFDLHYSPLFRYSIALLKTFSAFITEKPDLIFVQNPSLILSLFAVNYGFISNIPVIVDAHNAGVYPLNGKHKWANHLATYLFKRATITLVTNKALAVHVEKNGGSALVIPDPIPDLHPPPTKQSLNGRFNILFICSWADDEPYDEVMKAASLLDKDIYIYITGNSKGKESGYASNIPENVVLTGYLEENAFIEMLFSCDAVMDLTTRDNCLVCGAYESVAAEKPLIISKSQALVEYFSEGVLYTNNTGTDIAEQIRRAVMHKEEMRQRIREFKDGITNAWNSRLLEIERMLERMQKQ